MKKKRFSVEQIGQSRKPEIHYLNAVVVLAEKLNYTSAASRLGMTQSGLSRCIQAVEHSLGVSLFERSRGRVELTDSGRAYVERLGSLSCTVNELSSSRRQQTRE
jgi:DNA-binding transcriptional LysR family regulator